MDNQIWLKLEDHEKMLVHLVEKIDQISEALDIPAEKQLEHDEGGSTYHGS